MKYFEYYKQKASDTTLSATEKVGRYEKQSQDERHIFDDFLVKLPALADKNATIIDIGCGCSDPVQKLIANSREVGNKVVLVDSAEMLELLPDHDNITKVQTQFPDPEFIETYQQSADAVIVYSVFHCVYLETDFILFVDMLLKLLKSGGTLLLGDLPNSSKKKRFLSSQEGKAFHQAWSGDSQDPVITWNEFEPGTLDDSLIMMLMSRYRQMGFETYLLPQPQSLPFSRTREDLLVRKW